MIIRGRKGFAFIFSISPVALQHELTTISLDLTLRIGGNVSGYGITYNKKIIDTHKNKLA
jgi:hypothetical protein